MKLLPTNFCANDDLTLTTPSRRFSNVQASSTSADSSVGKMLISDFLSTTDGGNFLTTTKPFNGYDVGA